MARLIGRLTEVQVRRLGTGWHNDGGGLYLHIELKHQRYWVFRYGAGGKRYHGLGPVHTIGLAEAREQARKCRSCCSGRRPDRARQGRAGCRQADRSQHPDVRRMRRGVPRRPLRRLDQPEACARVESLAHDACLPEIGNLPVAAIDTAAVLRVLEPAWTTIPETAPGCATGSKVLDWARVRGYRRARTRPAGAAISIISCPPARSSRG